MEQRQESGRPVSRRTARLAILATACLLAGARTEAAAVLRDSTFTIAFRSPTVCEVDAAFTIEQPDAGEIEHRLQAWDGTSVELMEIGGGVSSSGVPATIGRTRSLILRPPAAGIHAYRLRYRVRQPPEWAYRCPLWLPTAPTDGRSREILLSVSLPDGAVPGSGGLPRFAWQGEHGTVRLGHLPPFVSVPYATAEHPGSGGWDISQVMDAAAVAVIGCASLFFLWRRKRR